MSQQDPRWDPPTVNDSNESRVRSGVTGMGLSAMLFGALAIVVVAYIVIYFSHVLG